MKLSKILKLELSPNWQAPRISSLINDKKSRKFQEKKETNWRVGTRPPSESALEILRKEEQIDRSGTTPPSGKCFGNFHEKRTNQRDRSTPPSLSALVIYPIFIAKKNNGWGFSFTFLNFQVDRRVCSPRNFPQRQFPPVRTWKKQLSLSLSDMRCSSTGQE